MRKGLEFDKAIFPLLHYTTRGEEPDFPMYYITWQDCLEFTKRLSDLTGRTYRLPSEAEWEFAARGGNQSQGYRYAGSDDIEGLATYRLNCNISPDSLKKISTAKRGIYYEPQITWTVKRKGCNELGLYGMCGNVWEWCNDWYDKNYYKHSPLDSPLGADTAMYKVAQGGAWFNEPFIAESLIVVIISLLNTVDI